MRKLAVYDPTVPIMFVVALLVLDKKELSLILNVKIDKKTKEDKTKNNRPLNKRLI